MTEQPVNLSTVIYLGVFSRAEQRVLQVIFKGIVEGGGSCAATLAMIARDSNTIRGADGVAHGECRHDPALVNAPGGESACK
jgi:hypothetical protein